MFIETWPQGISLYLEMASVRYCVYILVCMHEARTRIHGTNNNCHRLLILVFLVIFNVNPTTYLTEGRFQSSGQLQRPFTIASTPLPVMSGAMAASSMR